MRGEKNLKKAVGLASASAGIEVTAYTFPQGTLLGIEQGIAIANVFFNKIRIVANIILQFDRI